MVSALPSWLPSSLLNVAQARWMRVRTSSQVGTASDGLVPARACPAAENPEASIMRTGSGECSFAGFTRTQTWRASALWAASRGGSEMTARSAPACRSLERMRRPEGRAAAAGGISTTTVPPGLACQRACWTQASSDSSRGGTPYSQRPRSPAASSAPQLRSANGGLHTTASAVPPA